ncbi:MAG: flagellar assembly protein FliW [Nitrospinota bacterium]|nr:flagellar assembly protein FliW [Nitrospinota bacterium]
MKILTARFGEIDIDPAKIITFNDGVIGFPEIKRYIILPFMEGTEFELLQAVDFPNLGFVMINPFLFCEDYAFDITDGEQEMLKAKSIEDVTVKVIVTIPPDPKDMTANMQAPVVINESRLLAKQVILQDSQWDTKMLVFKNIIS